MFVLSRYKFSLYHCHSKPVNNAFSNYNTRMKAIPIPYFVSSTLMLKTNMIHSLRFFMTFVSKTATNDHFSQQAWGRMGLE